MKTLQSNFTTPAQSKRLLELGVPADSADCAMFPYDETFKQYELRVVPFNKVFSTYAIYNEDGTIYPGKTPCWSVGRLIEIYLTCTLEYHPYDDFYTETPSLHLMAFDKDRLVEDVIEIMSEDEMDFSKLD